ncbi:MAG: septum formation initiator family protein [Minisyncoccia bacterium]
MDFQQKRKIKSVMYSKVTLFILLIIFIFLAKGAWGIYIKAQSSRNSLAETNKEYTDLETRENMLTGNIARLKTEEGIEAEIRSKYSVAKSGEVSIVIVDKDATNTTNKGGSGSGFWGSFLNWLK